MSNDAHARPAPDSVLADIADYVIGHDIEAGGAYQAARYCLVDSMGCAVEALNLPECTKRRAGSGDEIQARSAERRFQHRHDDPLARF